MAKDSSGRSNIRNAKKEVHSRKRNDELFVANSQASQLVKSKRRIYSKDDYIMNFDGKILARNIQAKGRVTADEGITTHGFIRAGQVITRSIKAPFFEGSMVNRFQNTTKQTLSRGDVVLISISTLCCPGNTGEVTLFLKVVSVENARKQKLAGIVVGNEEMGAVGFEEIPPEKYGFVCIGGICPLVRVDSSNFKIEEGETLIAGPLFTAVPYNAASILGFSPVRLGIALSDVEEGDHFTPVLIQPGNNYPVNL